MVLLPRPPSTFRTFAHIHLGQLRQPGLRLLKDTGGSSSTRIHSSRKGGKWGKMSERKVKGIVPFEPPRRLEEKPAGNCCTITTNRPSICFSRISFFSHRIGRETRNNSSPCPPTASPALLIDNESFGVPQEGSFLRSQSREHELLPLLPRARTRRAGCYPTPPGKVP